MVDFYVQKVKDREKTIDQVPVMWRAEVAKIINGGK